MRVILDGDKIVFNVHFYENHKAKSCGARWSPSRKTWVAKANSLIASAIQSQFPEEDIDPAILAMSGSKQDIPVLSVDPNSVISGISHDGSPIRLRPRQIEGINKAWPHLGFALFWVMGAGKTLASITLANLRRTHGIIDRLQIICPTSIKGVWKKEFDRYSALPHSMFVMESGGKAPKFDEFPIMVVGVEALSQGGAFGVAKEFLSGGRAMVIVDESSSIKNYDATRTVKCWELGELAVSRLILTGTNVTQGLQDLFAQMYFVNPSVIGEISYFSFRNTYCVMGGFENRKIVGYRDPQRLLDKIRPHCDVIKKSDLKDLPPKQYQIREVKATPEQVKACKELAKEMKTILGDRVLTVQNSLEAMLRFQQISGGFDQDGNSLSKNPKLTELVALLEEFDGKAIIWARYIPEVMAIEAELNKRWPGSCVSMTGAVPPSNRQSLVDSFEASPVQRFMVANQQTAGRGLTIIAATLSVYYSNTFSLEDRLQSEDRNHRIGQVNMVMYVDLISDLKVDRHVVGAIAQKKDVADYASNGLRIDDMI